MQTYFYQLADDITARMQGDERFTCTFSAEDSDFVRMNKGVVRQAGSVAQRSLTINLITGMRHTAGSVSLSGDLSMDRAWIDTMLVRSREKMPHLPEDPHHLYATDVRSSEQQGKNLLAKSSDVVPAILDAGHNRDMVGLYASGGMYYGFANSFGQRNWFSSFNHNLEWSFYSQADKAVKSRYSGFEWDLAAFRGKVDWANEQLDVLTHPSHTVHPGRYRVYISPYALYDVVGMLGWGCFGLKSHRTKQTPLLHMLEGGAKLHSAVTMFENTHDGIAPNFQDAGFIKPDYVSLIEKGELCNTLVSPRSAKEYGIPTNGASGHEAPESVEMLGGEIQTDQILRQLDTGIYINNVWYLNYSDRSACRMTGMTRFATFWVENGIIKAPLSVMRFDETLYRMLGENLIGLTAERDLIMDSTTYQMRSTESGRLPGALVGEFSFTL
ncbi:MAG: TldE/PmbA family protein [Nitrospiraceae bacterium]|nr:TldE/PmbA family protein [Nitrospiraceae bacterium]|tara:strand:- start:4410 stop:5732 length:1323 start_codon:yes stop_codon:yes gene_type:complete